MLDEKWGPLKISVMFFVISSIFYGLSLIIFGERVVFWHYVARIAASTVLAGALMYQSQWTWQRMNRSSKRAAKNTLIGLFGGFFAIALLSSPYSVMPLETRYDFLVAFVIGFFGAMGMREALQRKKEGDRQFFIAFWIAVATYGVVGRLALALDFPSTWSYLASTLGIAMIVFSISWTITPKWRDILAVSIATAIPVLESIWALTHYEQVWVKVVSVLIMMAVFWFVIPNVGRWLSQKHNNR